MRWLNKKKYIDHKPVYISYNFYEIVNLKIT